MTYVGLLPPGMMNMTVVNHSIKSGLTPAIRFSLGASFVVAIQAFLALTFAQLISEHLDILELLKKIAVFVFIILGIYFYILAKRRFEPKGKDAIRNLFFQGVMISSFNMLAIPFFFSYSTIMEMNGWIHIKQPFVLIFVSGAVSGAFALFTTYAYFAQVIAKKAGFIAKNINYILAIFFIVLALLTLSQLIFFD